MAQAPALAGAEGTVGRIHGAPNPAWRCGAAARRQRLLLARLADLRTGLHRKGAQQRGKETVAEVGTTRVTTPDALPPLLVLLALLGVRMCRMGARLLLALSLLFSPLLLLLPPPLSPRRPQPHRSHETIWGWSCFVGGCVVINSVCTKGSGVIRCFLPSSLGCAVADDGFEHILFERRWGGIHPQRRSIQQACLLDRSTNRGIDRGRAAYPRSSMQEQNVGQRVGESNGREREPMESDACVCASMSSIPSPSHAPIDRAALPSTVVRQTDWIRDWHSRSRTWIFFNPMHAPTGIRRIDHHVRRRSSIIIIRIGGGGAPRRLLHRGAGAAGGLPGARQDFAGAGRPHARGTYVYTALAFDGSTGWLGRALLGYSRQRRRASLYGMSCVDTHMASSPRRYNDRCGCRRSWRGWMGLSCQVRMYARHTCTYIHRCTGGRWHPSTMDRSTLLLSFSGRALRDRSPSHHALPHTDTPQGGSPRPWPSSGSSTGSSPASRPSSRAGSRCVI